MTGVLLILKRLLNSIEDDELNEMSLWINNDDEVEIVAFDDNAIVLITDKSKVKIDDKEW